MSGDDPSRPVTDPAPPVGGSPAWGLPRGVVVLLALACLVVAVAGIRAASGLLGPVFLALVLVIAVSPAQSWLRARGAPQWVAVFAIIVLLYALVMGFGLLLTYSLARLATLLPQYSAQAQGLVDAMRAWLHSIGIGQAQAAAVGDNLDLAQLLGLLGGILGGLTGVFSNLVFVLILLFFMGIDAASYRWRLDVVRLTRPAGVASLVAFASGTRRYLVVSTAFGIIVAAADTVALAIIGIPLPVLWGLLSFVTNYIPNIGFFIGVIPPALLGLLSGGMPAMLAVIVVYSVINFVIQSIIQPKVVGDVVGLSVTVTFLGLAFWTWVMGPLGAILAIPLTLFAKALLVDIDPETSWIGTLIGARPAAGATDQPVRR